MEELTFETLNPGDLFSFEGNMYIKIRSAYVDDGGDKPLRKIDAIDLKTGNGIHLDKEHVCRFENTI